jgi:hypothetical protein
MIYGLGVAGLIAHLVLGIALLNRWSARGRPLHGGRWTSALAGSGTPKPTRLLVSEHVRAPLSWGLRRPVILIDPASAARDHDAPAILAHEAAHIARGDWLTLMAARLALAVFWFNPLVWVMLRALVQQCEEAADARALAHCEPTSYAETLMTCLAGRGKAHRIPANGMAAGHGLSRRVHQVLEARPGDLLHRSRGMLLALSAVPVVALVASGISFARAPDPLPTPHTTRSVHADGSVETRRTAADGQMTIRVASKDGRSVWTQRYTADTVDAVPPPEPPALRLRPRPRHRLLLLCRRFRPRRPPSCPMPPPRVPRLLPKRPGNARRLWPRPVMRQPVPGLKRPVTAPKPWPKPPANAQRRSAKQDRRAPRHTQPQRRPARKPGPRHGPCRIPTMTDCCP